MTMQVNASEIRIPVPWGFIAGKLWGDPKQETILAVHGLQDNASSFDRLAPLLLKPSLPFSILAIDLPGHGLSSHFPSGRPLYFMDIVSAVYRVINWLFQNKGMTQLLYIGHSFGGQIGIHVAAIYPECIEKLVVLDSLGPPTIKISEFLDYFKRSQSQMESLEKKMSEFTAPTYSVEEALEKIKARFHGHLTDDAAKILLTRNTKPFGNRVSFTLDQRLKFVVYPPFTKEQQYALFTKITCPLQLIVAEETRRAGRGYYASRMEVFSHCSSSCDIFPVDGNHDVHLEHPERVCPLLHQFLFHSKSSL